MPFRRNRPQALLVGPCFCYSTMATHKADQTYLTAIRRIQDDIQDIKQMLTHIIETRCDRYDNRPIEPFELYR